MSYEKNKENLISQIDLVLETKEIKDSIESNVLNRENLKNDLINNEEKLWKASENEIVLYKVGEKKLNNIKHDILIKMPSPKFSSRRIFIFITIISIIISILGYYFLDSSIILRWYDIIKKNFIISFFILILCFAIITWIYSSYKKRAENKRSDFINKEEDQVGIGKLKIELQNIEERIKVALREKGILPLLRELIDSELKVSYEMILPQLTTDGLSEVFNAEYEISTDAGLKLKGMLNSMPGGSIGIAGPRGVGKSTLITAVCSEISERDKGLSVMVSAPVDYEAREFILHLFSSVCDSLLKFKDDRSEYIFKRKPPLVFYTKYLSPYIKIFKTLIASFIVIACFVFSIITIEEVNISKINKKETNQVVVLDKNDNSNGLTNIILKVLNPEYQNELRKNKNTRNLTKITLSLMNLYNLKLSFFLKWTLILVFVFSLLRYQEKYSKEYEYYKTKEEKKTGIFNDAEKWLKKIKFQQSYSSGWSGSLKLPIGVTEGINETKSFVERQFTLPEIVSEYRKFLTEVSVDYKIIIGIDELDKIHNENSAHKFLNDIKAILNIEKCFYLISVSESAMSSFERRGIAFRDVFDSSFDDILSVDYLNFEESKHLLRRRVIGLPIVFIALCYCCSGGLARDLIRVCRRLFEHRTNQLPNCSINNLAATLLKEDVDLKLKALLIIIQDFPIKITAQFIKELRETKSMKFNSCNLEKIINKIFEGIKNTNSDEKIIEAFENLKIEFASYLLYCSTILLFFSKELTEQNFVAAEKNKIITQLAGLGQSLAGNPIFSLSLINSFRDSNQMEVIEFDI